MRYDPWGFFVSVLVAVLLAIVALWVRFGLERVVRWRRQRLNWSGGHRDGPGDCRHALHRHGRTAFH